MGRAKVIISDIHPYHITARSNNRDWFDINLMHLYEVYSDCLIKNLNLYRVKLHAFILMNNHFHLMVSTPESNISTFAHGFMNNSSKAISKLSKLSKLSKRVNHMYGARNHKSLITTSEYYAHCLKYLYRNPVEVKLCDRVENYRFSTLSKTSHKIQNYTQEPVYGHNELLSNDPIKRLEFFNNPYENEVQNSIIKGLKKQKFKPSTNRKTRLVTKLPKIYIA